MKILAVLPRFPYPLEKGDKLRAYHQLRQLAKSNQIYLFCTSHVKLSPEEIEAVSVFCAEVKIVKASKFKSLLNAGFYFATGRSLQLGYWDSMSTRAAFRSFEKKVKPDVLYCQMVRTMPWVEKSKTAKVIDYQDALSINVSRRAKMSSGLWKRILNHEAQCLEKAEQKALAVFDRHTIISRRDRRAVRKDSNIHIDVVTNGIDSDYFAPSDVEKTADIVFCGNMQYEPNVNAAKFLVERVMPKVWRRLPDTTVVLAGAEPTKAVRALAGPKVTVTGWVPDIRPCYQSARIFVAPMLSGSGLQNKLLEAMSLGIPCVTTIVANGTLGATSKQEILVGKCTDAMVSHIVRLLGDSSLREHLSIKGRAFVQKNYSWDESVKYLELVLSQAAKKDEPKPQRRKKWVPNGNRTKSSGKTE